MPSLIHRLRAIWRAVRGRSQADRDLQDEMRLHIDLDAERLIRQGLDPMEARRQAAIRFGGVERFKEATRDEHGFRWLDALSLDTRLGIRMLVKYRGLTVIGGFAMAVAIAIGATGFEIFGEILTPTLPFAEGDRIVAPEISAPDPSRQRDLLIDLVSGRAALTGLEDLGGWGTIRRNLVSRYASPETVRIAQMSASGFRLAGVVPLRGRPLLPSDEEPAADRVVVVGHDEWQRRFGGDPALVGQHLTLGAESFTVVGIMPDGFAFPFDHQYWVPLKTRSAVPAAAYHLFARLAPGRSMAEEQGEFQAVVRSMTAGWPSAERPTSAVLLPYTRAQVDLSSPGTVWLMRIARLLASVLTIVVSINLAILFYARTVTRAGELAIRAALGASRRRILSQLFVEALALSLVGAAGGLLLSKAALEAIQSLARSSGGVPFWIRFELSPSTTIAALALAALAALVMGVIPGMKVTGRRLNTQLQLASLRGGTRLGRVWSTLVVVQVAVAVAVLPIGLYLAGQVLRLELEGPGLAADRFGIGVIAPETTAQGESVDQVAQRNRLLLQRLEEEPGVDAVTLSSSVPGFASGARVEFEDSVRVAVPAPWHVSRMDVLSDMLDVYGAQLVAGRRFTPSDAASSRAVIVNQTFARWLAGDGAALGARFRYPESRDRSSAQATYEVVGVVRDFPHFPDALNLDTPAMVYHPADVGQLRSVVASARFRDQVPGTFGARLREIAAQIDPSLQVPRAMALSSHYGELVRLWRYAAGALALATLSVLLLSAAGMYALMSVTIAQRTREIGIRIALGAPPRRLLAGVLTGVARRVTVGVVGGALVSLVPMALVGLSAATIAPLLAGVGTIIVMIGVLAAYGPARRALRIDPSEALRGEG